MSTEKKSNTRFQYAVGSTLLTFGYILFIPEADASSAFLFLTVVAGGFGVSKATEHLTLK